MRLNARSISYILITGLVAGAALFFRLYPLITQGQSDARTLASMVVANNLRQSVQQFIEKTRPELSDLEKLKLGEANFQQLIKENPKKVFSLIDEGTKQLMANRPKDMPQYLLEADSYYFYGLTENIREFGSISRQIRHGKFFDPLILAPVGNWQPFCLHPYVGFWLYKLTSLFNPGVDMIRPLLFTVVLLATFCVVPFAIISYRLGLSATCAFTGMMFFALSPLFTQRTAYGWYDTDVYNILFPAIIFGLFFQGLLETEKPGSGRRHFLLAALFTGLYELFWEGWGFIFAVILASLPVWIALNKTVLKSGKSKTLVINTFLYIGASLLAVSIFSSPYAVIDTFTQSAKMLSSFMGTKFELWPDIFLTVGETQSMTLSKVSFLVLGNVHLVYLAFLGVLISIVKSARSKNSGMLYASTMLLIFLTAFTYLSMRAARNAVLLTVPLPLALALCMQHLYDGIKAAFEWLKGRLPLLRRFFLEKAVLITAALAILAINLLPLYAAYQITSRVFPIYNRTWEKVLERIKNETPQDSIINTWWCPGHFITGVAKRGATVDGATQHLPQTYWMANILMSQDEKTALGLLRMLDSSGNQALDYLTGKCGLLTSDAVDLIKEIAPLSREQALSVALKTLAKDEAEELLSFTHGTPKPSYFMIYNDLVDTYLALPYIGNWDFKKAEVLVSISKDNKQKIKIPSRSSKGYVDFLLSLTGGIPPVSPQYPEIFRSKTMVVFENRFVLETSGMEAFMVSPDGTKFINPKSLIYIKDNELKEKKYTGVPTLPFSLLLLEKNNSYKCIILDSSMAKSLLFRLYYMKGKGLEAFQPYIEEEDPLTKTNILVYKIDWDKLK